MVSCLKVAIVLGGYYNISTIKKIEKYITVKRSPETVTIKFTDEGLESNELLGTQFEEIFEALYTYKVS